MSFKFHVVLGILTVFFWKMLELTFIFCWKNIWRGGWNCQDLYLVFEFMETDLHHVIKKGNILKEIHRQYIMYQLFKVYKLSELGTRQPRHDNVTMFSGQSVDIFAVQYVCLVYIRCGLSI